MSTAADEDAIRMTDRVAVEGGEERKGKTEERTEENSDSERGTKRRVGGRKADWIEEAGNTTDGQIRKEDDGKQGFVYRALLNCWQRL